MNAKSTADALARISAKMEENKAYLIELDQRNGDGDLGISMCAGFAAAERTARACGETDLGKLLMKCGSAFNEAAPSTLGTILSFGFMGMAKALKGGEEADFVRFAAAFSEGVQRIMDKARSKPGEKTILDALWPAAQALTALDGDPGAALEAAVRAAEAGSDSTRDMIAVHGRAAYYGEKSLGVLDGGAVAGRLIVAGIAGK